MGERLRLRFLPFLHKFMKDRPQEAEKVGPLFIYCIQSRVESFYSMIAKMQMVYFYL